MDKTHIVGVEKVKFTGSDGTEISGITLYYTEALDPTRGTGQFAGKLFLTTARLAALDYKPTVGQTVEVLYDRRGKVKAVTVVDDDLIV